MGRVISQREARRLKRRVAELEAREVARREWRGDYFGCVEIARDQFAHATDAVPVAIRTARRLGHYVVAVEQDGLVRFMGVPQS